MSCPVQLRKRPCRKLHKYRNEPVKQPWHVNQTPFAFLLDYFSLQRMGIVLKLANESDN